MIIIGFLGWVYRKTVLSMLPPYCVLLAPAFRPRGETPHKLQNLPANPRGLTADRGHVRRRRAARRRDASGSVDGEARLRLPPRAHSTSRPLAIAHTSNCSRWATSLGLLSQPAVAPLAGSHCSSFKLALPPARRPLAVRTTRRRACMRQLGRAT